MSDPLKTDKNVYLEPAPAALPPAGSALTDPTFGTTILRVTDEKDGTSCTNAYSYWPSFNCNNTRLFCLIDNTGFIYDFDPVGFKLGSKRPLWVAGLPGGGWPGTEDAIWSGTDPDVIFTHWAMKIWAYNVVSKTYTLVADLTGKAGNAANLQQMTKTPDDQSFGFNLQDADWKRLGCLAWNRQAGITYTYLGTVDEVQLDKTGQYLVILTGQQSQDGKAIEAKIVNLTTKQVTDLTDGAPDYCMGHKDCGRGIAVGYDNWQNAFNSRQLSNPHQFSTIFSLGNDWSESNHCSLLADGDQWLLVSTFVANTLPNSGLFKNEILLVATDGSQRVRRVAHHHANYGGQYWNSPRADISRDGQFGVFTSPWGSTTRRDVFIVRIPPAALPAPPPTGSAIPMALRKLADDIEAGRIK
jgi:hypothetical protein